MNRGSKVIQANPRARAARFNEAPIHESGKCCQPSLSEADGHRFNEAPIHESGKCRTGGDTNMHCYELQ